MASLKARDESVHQRRTRDTAANLPEQLAAWDADPAPLLDPDSLMRNVSAFASSRSRKYPAGPPRAARYPERPGAHAGEG
jgi:hypothetical protein